MGILMMHAVVKVKNLLQLHHINVVTSTFCHNQFQQRCLPSYKNNEAISSGANTIDAKIVATPNANAIGKIEGI